MRNLLASLRVFQTGVQLEQGQEGGIQTEKKIQDPRGRDLVFFPVVFLRLYSKYNKQR